MQISFFEENKSPYIKPFRTQLLKWVGNKQKFANEIISYFPTEYKTYIEPFLGSGGVLASLAPKNAIASDNFKPLMEIWFCLKDNPEQLKEWYNERWIKLMRRNKKEVYEEIKQSYNQNPNGADFVFLCRSCYGGVVRFRKIDGYMSTPVGIHDPIKPESFNKRVDEWYRRVQGTTFFHLDYKKAMIEAKESDLIYCDPPYVHSQSILYGSQDFVFEELIELIRECKRKNVYVALSIDGIKKSGKRITELPIPKGVFKREIFLNIGRSMLRRFQMNGESLENEEVMDRLFLTY